MNDKRVSLLIKNQVPDFILEEYPKFVSFIEAYYEFLDQNSYGKAKDIRYISDVDVSIDEFEQQFFNTFIPHIPRDIQVNKDFIIKNIMPLYLSRGSTKSFQFLFRLLFSQESDVEYPGRFVLRASDARWTYENILRITTVIYSKYISDGVKDIYYLPDVYDLTQFSVYIDGIVSSDFQLYLENQKIIFNTPPPINSEIKIYYSDFNINVLSNRKVIGLSSGTQALIEKTGIRRKYGSNYFELLINSSTLIGDFRNGEPLYSDIVFGDSVINFYLETFSDVEAINIIDGGSSYNVGDPVIIRGTSIKDAVAVVDKVATGKINDLQIYDGGAGYKIGTSIFAVGYSTDYFDASVVTIDDLGVYSANSISFNTDVIGDYGNVNINAADYGFPQPISENVNTIISDALSISTMTDLGEITSLAILTSDISSNLSPQFDAIPETLVNDLTIRDFGFLGKIEIINGGLGYQVNDQLVFTNELSFSGQGAAAHVSSVDGSGRILTVQIDNTGMSYKEGMFPRISVDSVGGSGAVLIVACIMGDGQVLNPVLANTVAGEIISIKVLDGGSSYTQVPGVDLKGYGDGLAVANAVVGQSYLNLGGKWKTSDGLLSTEEIVLQGRDYYIDFSYITSTQVEFYKYKNMLKSVLHPVGLVNYAKYNINKDVDVNTNIIIISTLNKTLSGTINISNGSSIVIGNNTKFNVANTIGTFTIGTQIAVNNQVKIVSSIQSNTQFTVDTDFTLTSNNESIKII